MKTWLSPIALVSSHGPCGHTDKKEKKIFLIYKEISSCKVIYEERLPNIRGIYEENAQIFPDI
jgi:hypothetical protein